MSSSKRIVALSLLMVVLCYSSAMVAQVAKTEYFMSTSIMRTYLNPAYHPDQNQLLVPVLPNIGASVLTNTINLDHLTFKRNGERVTFLHPAVSDHDFLKELNRDNYIRAEANYRILALGLMIRGYYTGFDIGIRGHADLNLPRSAFALLKTGFDQEHSSVYDLKNMSATAILFGEIGVSQSRTFLDNTLTVGARAKFLLGGAYLDLNANHFEIEAGPERWRALSQVKMSGAAPGVNPKYDKDGKLDDFDFDWTGMPGYGAGIDLGVVYDLRDVLPALNGLKVSAALNDIGFIRWSEKNSLSLYSPDTEVIISPNDYTLNSEHGKSLSDILEDAWDDFREVVNLKEKGDISAGRTTMLRMNMLLGAEYELLKHKLSVGALYSARFGDYYTSHELTVSGNYRPLDWLATSLSYSFIHSSFDTFGLALHLMPRKGVTFFLSSDYVIPHVSTQFLPTSSKGLNFQLGFSIPIGKIQQVEL